MNHVGQAFKLTYSYEVDGAWGSRVVAEMILGYVSDKTEFPIPGTREDKLAVALHAIRS